MVPNPARIMDAVGLTVRSVINGSPVQSGFPAPIYCAAFLNNDTLLMTSTGAVLTVRRSDGSVLQRRDVSYDLGGPELIAVERSNSIYLAGTLFASLRRYGLSFTNADPLREFGRPIETMVVDPGARRLFTATSANDVVVWNTDADTVLFALEGSLGYTRTLAIAPDGTEIALTTTAADAVRILSAGTGLLREAVRNPPWDFSTAGSVQFDREGKTLLFISRDDNGVSRLRAYDRVARQLDTTVSWRASRAAVAPGSGSIALLRTDSILIATPDGKQIVAGARVPQLSSWCLRALNDDRFIASFVDSTVRIYNGTTGAEERVINAGTVVYDILVLSDRDLTASGPTLVFVERSSASDSTIRLDLDVRTYPNLDVVRRLQNVGTPFIDGTILNRIAASRFAREFAVGRDNGTIDIVDGTTGAVVRTRSTGGTPVVHVTCDPVQQTVYLGTADGRTARLRDAWSSPASSVDEGELSIDLEAGTCVEAWYTVDGRQIDVNALGSAPLKNTPLIMTRTVGRNRTSRFVWYP
jgi:WD40 repeat protein